MRILGESDECCVVFYHPALSPSHLNILKDFPTSYFPLDILNLLNGSFAQNFNSCTYVGSSLVFKVSLGCFDLAR